MPFSSSPLSSNSSNALPGLIVCFSIHISRASGLFFYTYIAGFWPIFLYIYCGLLACFSVHILRAFDLLFLTYYGLLDCFSRHILRASGLPF